MKLLKEYEIDVIKQLTANSLTTKQTDEILESYEFASFEYTGAGYFLSIIHPKIPKERIVCSRPILIGETEDGIICGFVIFIENNQITIECHEWGEMNIPEDFRDRHIEISEADI